MDDILYVYLKPNYHLRSMPTVCLCYCLLAASRHGPFGFPFRWVCLFDVVPHMRIVHKVLLAVVALEVSFPRVHHIVSLQLVYECKLQIALIALHFLEMKSHVADDRVNDPGGGLSAQIARKMLLTVWGVGNGIVTGPVLFRLVVDIFLVDSFVGS